MKHIAIIFLLALLASCSSLEYLSNDVDDIPKTMKAQQAVMQQVLDNYYLMGMIDYRNSLAGEPLIVVKSTDLYYLHNLKKVSPDLYKQAKRLIEK